MKQSIKIIKYVVVIGFCVVCIAGNISNFMQRSVDAKENIVFFETEAEAEGSPATETEASSTIDEPGIININEAQIEELMLLPGIGEVKAKAIIEYREAFGGFVAKEEITEVKGIGEATYEKIKDLITIK